MAPMNTQVIVEAQIRLVVDERNALGELVRRRRTVPISLTEANMSADLKACLYTEIDLPLLEDKS